MSKIVDVAEITCPMCRYRKEERMPLNACLHYYECVGCGEVLTPDPGDCCIFCSFSNVKCPPPQVAN